MHKTTLHLRRRLGETVLVGSPPDEISILVESISESGEVNLVFRAPRSVAIDRLEVARRKQRQSI